MMRNKVMKLVFSSGLVYLSHAENFLCIFFNVLFSEYGIMNNCGIPFLDSCLLIM